MLASDGSVRIERGFARFEGEPKSGAKAENDKAERSAKDADGLAPLSEKLVAELTAYRTSALAMRLAQHPAVALITLVHALALATFFQDSQASCLEIAPKSAWLSSLRTMICAAPHPGARSSLPRGAGQCQPRRR